MTAAPIAQTDATVSFGSTSPGMTPETARAWHLLTGHRTITILGVSGAEDGPQAGRATVLGLDCAVELISDGTHSALVARPWADQSPGSPPPVNQPWSLATAFPAMRRWETPTTPPATLRAVALTDPILAAATPGADNLLGELPSWQAWHGRHPDHAPVDGVALFGIPGLSGIAELLDVVAGIDPAPFGVGRAGVDPLLPMLHLEAPLTQPGWLGPLDLSACTVTVGSALFAATWPDRVGLVIDTDLAGHAMHASADLPIGPGTMVFAGRLGLSGGTLLSGSGGLTMPDLTASSGPGGEADVEVTIDWPERGALSVTELRVEVTVPAWTVADGVLALSDIDLVVVVADPLGAATTWAALGAHLDVGPIGPAHVGLDVRGVLPSGPVSGALSPGSSIKLMDVVTALGGDPTGLPPVSIDRLGVEVHPETGTWDADIDVTCDLSIGTADLPVVLQDLRVRAHGPGAHLELGGTFAIGATTFTVSATRAETGWAMSGATAPGTSIPVGRLIEEDLSPSYGPLTLPGSIRSAVVGDLSVDYDPGTGLALTGRLDFDIDGTAVDARIHLSAGTDSSGVTTLTGSVTLVIGAQRFTADLVDGASPALVLTWDPEDTGGVELSTLVAALSPTVAQLVPAVALRRAMVVVAPPASDDGSHRYLLAADLSVTDVGIDGHDLGPVGSLLGSDARISLDGVRLVVATSGFTAAYVATLPVPHEWPSLPAQGVERAVLAADVTLFGHPVPLELPIGVTTSIASVPPAGPAAQPAADDSEPRPLGVVRDTPTAPSSDPVTPRPDGTTWVPVEKTIGPLTLHRIGARYENGELTLALGADLAGGGLTLGLAGLAISTPLSRFDPSVSLDGLTITYRQAPVTLSGGLIRVPAEDDTGVRFDGEVMLGTTGLTVAALGSYAKVGGEASLFVFAFLDKDLGGPAIFHVTGLAAGFGWNRRLVLPALEDVASFPLVALAMGRSSGPPDPAAALLSLGPAVVPAAGEAWFAVGVRFTSFEIINSFALLSVAFGSSTTVGLVGESTVTMPPQCPPDEEPVAFARLLLKATIEPERGVLSVGAQLSPDSYIFSRACRLTGGFAFVTWFADQPGGARAGDFVVTLGGYHPAFARPDHYPVVAPVGYVWRIGDLELSGTVYFALTPSTLMAGGTYLAVWESGDLRAWFSMTADFLMEWRPFHYEIDVGVSVGVEYTVDLWFTSFRVTVHVDVELDLWGPSFGGEATIDLSVFSFTVSFGASRQWLPEPLSWPDFAHTFLPPSNPSFAVPVLPASVVGTHEPTPHVSDSYVVVRFAAGLQRMLGDLAVVSGTDVVLVTETVVPATSATFVDDAVHPWDPVDGQTPQPVDIGPCDIAAADWTSEHLVLVHRVDPSTGAPRVGSDYFDHVRVEPRFANVPRSVWALGSEENRVGAADRPLVIGALVGFTITPVVDPPASQVPVDVASLQRGDADTPRRAVARSQPPVASTPVEPGPDPTVVDPAAVEMAAADATTRRQGVLAALAGWSDLGVDLDAAAPRRLDVALRSAPLACSLGEPLRLGAVA